MENRQQMIDDLNSALTAKKNEYKMLNDSLFEVIERNGNKVTIDKLKGAIESTMDNIYEISEQIKLLDNEKVIVNRAFATKNEIDNMEQKSFYDAIEKQGKSVENNVKDKYGQLYAYLCSAQYIADEIGDANASVIKEIRIDVGDKLLKQHGY